MLQNFTKPTNSGTLLLLHIQPGAKKSEVAGIHGDRLKIRLKAPPVDGKANKALIDFLSDTLEIPKKNITIIRGEKSRQKDLEIKDISQKTLISRITPTSSRSNS